MQHAVSAQARSKCRRLLRSNGYVDVVRLDARAIMTHVVAELAAARHGQVELIPPAFALTRCAATGTETPASPQRAMPTGPTTPDSEQGADTLCHNLESYPLCGSIRPS